MKNFLCALIAVVLHACVVFASGGGDEFKGSHSQYDVTAEMAVMNMIESQTDPETEKVIIDEMVLKFKYLNNNFFMVDGFQVASVYFTDNEDEYVYDYYVDGDKVVKIVLYTKNGKEVKKQVYPIE